METEIRPSEKLKGFIQFLEDTKESYESAKKKTWRIRFQRKAYLLGS